MYLRDGQMPRKNQESKLSFRVTLQEVGFSGEGRGERKGREGAMKCVCSKLPWNHSACPLQGLTRPQAQAAISMRCWAGKKATDPAGGGEKQGSGGSSLNHSAVSLTIPLPSSLVVTPVYAK